MSSRLNAAMFAVSVLVLAACTDAPPPGSAREVHGQLVLALLPDEDPDTQRRKYAPLIEAIRTRTGIEARLSFVDDYEALVQHFAEGRVDIAYFGGFTFLAAEREAAAVPLVMRDIDAQFSSYVLVRGDSAARELSDLRGTRFVFGSRLSTSGHIMPRYFFRDLGIEPESFFASIAYSGAHDRTLAWIRDGKADAGVVNAQIARSWLSRDVGDGSGLRVVWQSPPFVDYVWAVHPSVSTQTRRALKEVFLSLGMDDPQGRRFLEAVGSRHFLPAHSDDFLMLRAAVKIATDTSTEIPAHASSR